MKKTRKAAAKKARNKTTREAKDATSKRYFPRNGARSHCVREITITYEGQNEVTLVKAPDLSTSGMFVSTARTFPHGAVLNLKFRLTLTNAEVGTRGEVRHSCPGVGVGVEFIGLETAAKKLIERELALSRSAEKLAPLAISIARKREMR